MKAIAHPLQTSRVRVLFIGNSIYRGIVTGYNRAFIVDQATRDAIVDLDPKSVEILKRVLRGRDIGRYHTRWANQWLIATFPSLGLDIDAYPGIKSYLLSFGKERLAQDGLQLPSGVRSRSRTSNAWYELQISCAYHEEFAKEKLFWMDMTRTGRFAYSSAEIYCNDKGFILTGTRLKYLCAILNSTLISWLMNLTTVTTGMGLLEWKKFAVEELPIPIPEDDTERDLVQAVDTLMSLDAASQESEYTRIESGIDQELFQMFGLTAVEIETVLRARN